MIEIIANIGNKGFALPMVQAYPIDVNLQQMLAWNPAQQALDYVPYIGNAFGDITVVRDLIVGRNATIAGNTALGDAGTDTVTVAGVLTTPAGFPAVIPAIVGNLTLSGTGILTTAGAVNATGTVGSVSGGGASALAGTSLSFSATKVVGVRATGWTAMTGTPLKTTFATSTVTLPQLAGLFMALQADLIAHGLIGT